MSRWRSPVRPGPTVLVAVVVLAAAVAAAGWTSVASGAAVAPESVTPPTTLVAPAGAVATVVENDFIPPDRDLSECISAVPKPGCGSKARGGWRQALVFGVLVVALTFIAWRLVRTARRNRGDPAGAAVPNGPGVPR